MSAFGGKADITLTCLECRLLTHYGPRQSDFAVTHKIAAHYRLTSVASNVDIAENARFKFQIIQPVLNHVTYADNANQLAVAKHRHVAHAISQDAESVAS